MHTLIKQEGLFFVEAYLPYKNQNKWEPINLVFDPGAVLTVIDPQFTDYLGYSAREDGIRKSSLAGAAGKSKGYIIEVPSFKCLGCEVSEMLIGCHDMDTDLGVAGLLGMNFLEHFRVDMNYSSGEVFSIERVNLLPES